MKWGDGWGLESQSSVMSGVKLFLVFLSLILLLSCSEDDAKSWVGEWDVIVKGGESLEIVIEAYNERYPEKDPISIGYCTMEFSEDGIWVERKTYGTETLFLYGKYSIIGENFTWTFDDTNPLPNSALRKGGYEDLRTGTWAIKDKVLTLVTDSYDLDRNEEMRKLAEMQGVDLLFPPDVVRVPSTVFKFKRK